MMSLKEQNKLMEGVVAEVDHMPVLAYKSIGIRSLFYDKISPDVMMNMNIQEESLKAKEDEEMRMSKEQEVGFMRMVYCYAVVNYFMVVLQWWWWWR